MRGASLLRAALGVDHKTVIDRVEVDQDAGVVVHVRVRARDRWRCAECAMCLSKLTNSGFQFPSLGLVGLG
jgi:hypothetical protein